jgi:hypothetical protein
VLDYKTGKVDSLTLKSVEELFGKDLKTHKKEILQALVYTFVLSRNFRDETEFQPVIYSLRQFFAENYSPEIRCEKSDFSFFELEEEFLQQLKGLVQEILSPGTVFVQTPHDEKCPYCPYRKICRRY